MELLFNSMAPWSVVQVNLMNATEYHFPALHISSLCQAVWDEQPITQKVFPASLAWMAFPITLRARCRALPVCSSGRTEGDSSGIVCCTRLLRSEGNFVDRLFSHVPTNTFLRGRKTCVWIWMKVLWVNYLILKPWYTHSAWEIRVQEDGERYLLELCLSLNTWEQNEKLQNFFVKPLLEKAKAKKTSTIFSRR